MRTVPVYTIPVHIILDVFYILTKKKKWAIKLIFDNSVLLGRCLISPFCCCFGQDNFFLFVKAQKITG
ncbi:Uncharacterized protein APZ42_031029 [Daphnia magna]|uniref:Uncharacterized protein n=1 Tax=Daphnia magna TaxID=35525 RepID=A0A162DCI7_9CRUS|nr:Uncharacterized protein APZ42_031029 [Daphnia magna]